MSIKESRTIERLVKPTKRGVLRLIGTVDVDGAGINHDLPEVDPFLLLDTGIIPKNNTPHFGAHPHRGHSVVTILINGKIKSWDSFRNDDHHVLSAPASYWVDAGSGVFHDETSVVENENDPSQFVHMFQLWVSVKEEDRHRAPRVQYDANLPTFQCMDPEGKTVVGTGTYHVGDKTAIETPHPMTVAHIRQNAGTKYHYPINPTHGGFVVLLKGKDFASSSFGGTTPTEINDVLVLANGGSCEYLEITTDSNASDIEYLVCSGERIEEPWFKKLVADGAIIAKSAEEARSFVPQVEAMSKAGKVEGGSFAPFGMPRADPHYSQ